jgi:hypothetical protein
MARYDDAIRAGLDFLIDDRCERRRLQTTLVSPTSWTGETKQAAYYFKQTVDVDPDDEGTRRNLGQALWTLGRTEEAVPDEMLAVAAAEPLKGDAARLDESSFYWVEPGGERWGGAGGGWTADAGLVTASNTGDTWARDRLY